MTTSMIEVEKLSKSYGGKRGIIDVSFQVGEGEVFGFLGPNGAGKTTTIRVLMALLRADSGTARIAGLDSWDRSLDGMVMEARDEGRTVFLSSHVLSEVEKTCTRVGIIREGRLVRIGGVAELKDIKRYEITISFAHPIQVETFARLEGVTDVQALNEGSAVRLAMQGAADSVIKAAAPYPVVSLTSYEPRLQDVLRRDHEPEDVSEA